MSFSYLASVTAKKGQSSPPPVDYGYLYTMGWNDLGQLALGDTTNRSSPTLVGSGFTHVSTGYYMSLALKGDGELWAWGLNESGQLGLGNVTSVSSPVQVGTQTGWTWMHMNGYDFTGTAFGVRGGALYGWGSNFYGELGLGDTIDRSSPTQIGSYTDWNMVTSGFRTGFAIRSTVNDAGTLWSWGFNSVGQLGLNNTTDTSSPVQIGTRSDWQRVSSGDSHTAAMTYDYGTGARTIWAWGENSTGQLGVGDTTNRSSPVQIGSDSDWLLVSAGGAHTMAIKTDFTLWGCGWNEYGQLGLNDNVSRSSMVLVGSGFTWVVGGYISTIAMKSDGSLWVWGGNISGELGQGDTTDRSSPVQIGSFTNYTLPQESFSLDTFSMAGTGSTSIIRTSI